MQISNNCHCRINITKSWSRSEDRESKTAETLKFFTVFGERVVDEQVSIWSQYEMGQYSMNGFLFFTRCINTSLFRRKQSADKCHFGFIAPSSSCHVRGYFSVEAGRGTSYRMLLCNYYIHTTLIIVRNNFHKRYGCHWFILVTYDCTKIFVKCGRWIYLCVLFSTTSEASSPFLIMAAEPHHVGMRLRRYSNTVSVPLATMAARGVRKGFPSRLRHL